MSSRARILLVMVAVLACAASIVPASAAVIHVKSDSTNDGPGTDWQNAYHTIGAGVGAATSGDSVWVARGTYFERITLKGGLGLYGGFAGNETDKNQRNCAASLTVIDGSAGGSVVTAPSGLTSSATVDGFTIRNGKARYGGGIYCDSSSSPTITNNKIAGNMAYYYGGGSNSVSCGGAIYCGSSSSPLISNNDISGNTASGGSASGYGGGIYCESSSSPTISNNTISGNKATGGGSGTGGGGIYCYSSPSTISSNVISANTSSYDGGGICCKYCAPTITSNTITHNFANSRGAGILCEFQSPTIRGNTIESNSGGTGGGIYCSNSSPTISNNIIMLNKVISGGGIYCSYSSAAISNNAISRNIATGVNYGYGGGGIYCKSSSSPSISNNNITGNSASVGGAIYSSSSPTISNNIIVFNSSGILRYQTGAPVLRNNDVYSNTDYNYSGLTAGVGDISADPLFLAPWVEEQHLRPGSPCIDTGNDSAVQTGWTDLDEKVRISGAHVDMGCFEWDSSPYWVRNVCQARAVPEQFILQLRTKPVTAAFGDAAYVEDKDRRGGLRIVSTQAVAPGDLITAVGQMTQSNGERSLLATSLSKQPGSASEIPQPLSLANSSLGGSDFFWNYSGESCGQQGITGAFGLNNIGLLITTWGRYTKTGDTTFTLDDGSGGNVKCVVPSGVPVSQGWKYVAVTGISSCEKVGNDIHRLLRLRSLVDLVPLQ
jgi:parallel beta-helix repeat protein